VVKVVDSSRQVAADRWLVKLSAIVDIVPERLPAIRALLCRDDALWEKLQGSPLLELYRERNFIDADEVEAIREEIVAGLENDIITYIATNDFPEKLVTRRLDEIERELERVPPEESPDDEEDGPADFSYLFK